MVPNRLASVAAAVALASSLGCGSDDGGGSSSSGGSAGSAGSSGGSAGSSGSAGTAGSGGSSGSSGSGGSGATAAAYPDGPYGTMVGDTFPPLEFEGYVNDDAAELANSEPFGAYSMDDVRSSERGYAIVHLSEFF